MNYEFAISSSNIKLRTKSGTLASGADATKTFNFAGANMNAEAAVILSFADACASVISQPIIEVTRCDTYIAYEVED